MSIPALISHNILVLIALFSSSVWAGSASELCSDPWGTVCVSDTFTPRATQAEIGLRKAQIRHEALAQARLPVELGGCDSQPTPQMIGFYEGLGYTPDQVLDEATLYRTHDFYQQDRELCLASIVESRVFESLGPLLNPERVRAAFETVRAALISAIRDEFEGQIALQPLSEEMVGIVSRVQFLLSDRYREWALLDSNPAIHHGLPNLAPLTNIDGGICGSDLLNRNAFSDSTGYRDAASGHGIHTGMMAVVGCPGQWLEALAMRDGTVEQNLYHLFGHEMSHMIHATWNRPANLDFLQDGTPMTFNSVPGYVRMMACLRQDYEPTLPAVGPSYRESNAPFLRRVLGREPSDIDFRSNEISADFWGTRVMSRLLAETLPDPDSRAFAAINGLRRLCFKPGTTQLYVTQSDTHPSGQMRVETALRSPELRRTLGCAVATTGGAWGQLPACSTRGEWR